MKLATYDDNWNTVDLTAVDQKVSLPLVEPKTKITIVCNWYKFKRTDGQPCNLKPFVYFCNDGLALFCNDLSKANLESLSKHGTNLFYLYLNELLYSGYANDFEKLRMWITTPTDDDDTTTIKYRLAKKLSYSVNEVGTVLTIKSPGDKTHMQLMTEFLRKKMEIRVISFVKLCIKQMKLADKVLSCSICDPDESNYLQGRHNINDKLSVGTFGCNYYTYVESEYETNRGDATYKSVIRYTPFVYFMSEKRQKILIIHELVHTKIGADHQHDEYFWYLVEHYAGFDRENDLAWNPDQCAENTKEFDSNHNVTCAQLIAEHKRTHPKNRRGYR